MPSLREIQLRFAAAIAGGGASAPTFIGAFVPGAADRMAIYSSTIRSNYRNAMSATYPVVRRIVGASFFHAAVDAYVDAHPSRSGDLNEYGDAFADFLHRYPAAGDLPYLPDVARLDWAIDEAHRAADGAAAPDAVLDALSHVAADALPHVRLGLEASCRLVASSFPLLRIWQVNQPGYDGDLRVDFTAGPHRLHIRREPKADYPECDDSGIVIEPIDAAHFEWLSAIARGATLAEALERAVDTDPAFHLQTALQKFIGDGSIERVADAAAQADRGMETSMTGLKAPRD